MYVMEHGNNTMQNYFSVSEGFDNTVYQHHAKQQGTTLRVRQNLWSSDKRPRFSSSTKHNQQHGRLTVSSGGIAVSNTQRHKSHHRPTFAGPIENVTVNVGREATLECLVNHLGKYKVSCSC